MRYFIYSLLHRWLVVQCLNVVSISLLREEKLVMRREIVVESEGALFLRFEDRFQLIRSPQPKPLI